MFSLIKIQFLKLHIGQTLNAKIVLIVSIYVKKNIQITQCNHKTFGKKEKHDKNAQCITTNDKVKLKDYRWLTVSRSKLENERKCSYRIESFMLIFCRLKNRILCMHVVEKFVNVFLIKLRRKRPKSKQQQ